MCKKYGHWRHECPERHKRRTREAMLSMVQHLGNDNDAVSKALWTISEDDDEYFAYANQEEENQQNSFESFVKSVSDEAHYQDREATADLENCFDDLAEHFITRSDMDDSPDFALPTRI